jgi:hypothetical protein
VGGGVMPGHATAEPMGPMIKLFMTADMLRSVFSAAQWSKISAWARQWIKPAELDADSARDHPWVPDDKIGSWTSNEASYGNSPTGQRAMAVWAAAVAGPADLRAALAWNWDHRTPAGHDFGWNDVLDHMFIPGTGGETIEGRDRKSLGYGLYAWSQLLMIADVARHAAWPRDLFTARTPAGNDLLSVAPFYGPLVSGEKPDPYGPEYSGYSVDKSKYLAVFETLYANCPRKDPACPILRRALYRAGAAARGDAYDPHVLHWNALLGVA